MTEVLLNVEYMRTECGFTQEDLANKLGVTKQTVSNWETGKVRMKRCYQAALVNLYKKYKGGCYEH